MAWFPEHLNLPKITNTTTAETQALYDVLNSGSGACTLDDVTFMIPVGFDSFDRARNFAICMNYILFNTTAKIHIVWSEKDGIFNSGTNLHGSLRANFKKLFAHENVELEDIFLKYGNTDTNALDNKSFCRFFMHQFIVNELDLLKTRSHGLSFAEEASKMRPNMPPPERGMLVRPAYLESLIQRLADRIRVSLVVRGKQEPFHRTKYLNQMLDKADTSVVVNYDADILIPLASMQTASQLAANGYAAVYPYGHMDSGRRCVRRLFAEDADTVDALRRAAFTGDLLEVGTMGCCIEWPGAYGQVIFFNTAEYKSIGGENEDFISWGAEDVERYVRLVRYRRPVARLNNSVIFHIEHERGPDSGTSNSKFQSNEHLWEAIQNMTQEELVEYYGNVEYLKKYDW